MSSWIKGDQTTKYNTALTPQEMKEFSSWLDYQSKLNNRNVGNDFYNYDLQGFYKQNPSLNFKGHLPDTFKKPNHPTFSIESKYSTKESPGGFWLDELYIPNIGGKE